MWTFDFVSLELDMVLLLSLASLFSSLATCCGIAIEKSPVFCSKRCSLRENMDIDSENIYTNWTTRVLQTSISVVVCYLQHVWLCYILFFGITKTNSVHSKHRLMLYWSQDHSVLVYSWAESLVMW